MAVTSNEKDRQPLTPANWLRAPLRRPAPASAIALAEQLGPVARHPSTRTGDRLILRVALRRYKFRSLVIIVGFVVPEPILARFERPDDRVPALSPVRRGGPRQRIITTTDVT